MTIHLEEVLDEAIKRAEELCKGAGATKSIAPEEISRTAEKIGIGAIKYNDLKQNPRTDIVFDWDQILTLSGNSGPYLQYTYARIKSVLVNSKIKNQKLELQFETQNLNNLTVQQLSNEEVSIMRTIYKFPEVVVEAAQTFSPNLLCNFLFDLSQKFNLFYDKERIIGSENENFRLLLTAAVGQILKNGLGLLGIEAPERM
jgi:arginyl-tRNA synthetase